MGGNTRFPRVEGRRNTFYSSCSSRGDADLDDDFRHQFLYAFDELPPRNIIVWEKHQKGDLLGLGLNPTDADPDVYTYAGIQTEDPETTRELDFDIELPDASRPPSPGPFLQQHRPLSDQEGAGTFLRQEPQENHVLPFRNQISRDDIFYFKAFTLPRQDQDGVSTQGLSDWPPQPPHMFQNMMGGMRDIDAASGSNLQDRVQGSDLPGDGYPQFITDEVADTPGDQLGNAAVLHPGSDQNIQPEPVQGQPDLMNDQPESVGLLRATYNNSEIGPTPSARIADDPITMNDVRLQPNEDLTPTEAPSLTEVPPSTEAPPATEGPMFSAASHSSVISTPSISPSSPSRRRNSQQRRPPNYPPTRRRPRPNKQSGASPATTSTGSSGESLQLECSQCGQEVKNQERLRRHIKDKHSRKRYRADCCFDGCGTRCRSGLDFRAVSNINIHQNEKHKVWYEQNKDNKDLRVRLTEI